MKNNLKIAIAGLGTVGGGAVKILLQNADMLAERAGRNLQIVAVSARNKAKARDFDLSGVTWVDSPLDLPSLDVDVIVELIGGADGIAKELVFAAIQAGKHVVTANKALIAKHGIELAELAEKHQVTIAYEAAVAGGIPIIKTIREGLAANKFSNIAGILNGTCNFILTSMQNEHKDFADALAEAQKIGYAEADPTFDIEGIDTAHKLAILTSLAYSCPLNTQNIHIEGITNITIRDINFADELGYAIKLLGISTYTENGILQRVHPAMISKNSTIGKVAGAYNGIIVEGSAVGRITIEGLGAGEGATASSVVGDIIDIARGAIYKPFAIPVSAIKNIGVAAIDNLVTSYYIRLSVVDKSGVLAAVTAIFADYDISLNSFLQNSHNPEEAVQVVITTHKTTESAMQKALKAIEALDSVIDKPNMIRIEDL